MWLFKTPSVFLSLCHSLYLLCLSPSVLSLSMSVCLPPFLCVCLSVPVYQWVHPPVCLLVREPGGPTVHPTTPGTFHDGPLMYLRVSQTRLHVSPDNHWDALELQPFVQWYPLAFTQALTERRSLMHHLNQCIIVLWHNGLNVRWNMLDDSFRII